MTRPSTTNGRRIADRTRELARELAVARARYWASLLARPQLCPPIVATLLHDPDPRQRLALAGWERRLVVLCGLARRMVATRRVADARAYARAVDRAAQWLAGLDLDCRIVNACADAIALWSGRRLPAGHRWAGERLFRPRARSRAWGQYWQGVEHGRRLRERLRNEIVTLNEGLVIHYVGSRDLWKIRDHAEGRSSLAREDLQQHAREGLMVAAARFDPEMIAPRTGRLIQFSTYATHWMRHYVDRAYQVGAQQVRLPLDLQVCCYKLARVLQQHPEIELDELARLAKLTPAKARKALGHMGWRMASMDAPLGRVEGRSVTLADLTPDQRYQGDERQGFTLEAAPGLDEQLDQDRVTVRMLVLLEGLEPEDASIVRELYGFEGEAQTAHQIARRRQVPRERIEQIHHRALATMRAQIETTT